MEKRRRYSVQDVAIPPDLFAKKSKAGQGFPVVFVVPYDGWPGKGDIEGLDGAVDVGEAGVQVVERHVA